MTPEKQKAIAFLNDEIHSLRLAPTINGCDMKPEWAEQLEIMQTCLEAVKVCSVDTNKTSPLTLEQLREMDGQKVLLYRMKSTEPLEPGTVKQNGDVLGDAGMLAYHELYLETWVAFTYHPAHIDREAWTAEWIYPENEFNLPMCSKCECNSKDAQYGHKNNFCPKCGRAMTPEAWAELEKRLRG